MTWSKSIGSSSSKSYINGISTGFGRCGNILDRYKTGQYVVNTSPGNRLDVPIYTLVSSRRWKYTGPSGSMSWSGPGTISKNGAAAVGSPLAVAYGDKLICYLTSSVDYDTAVTMPLTVLDYGVLTTGLTVTFLANSDSFAIVGDVQILGPIYAFSGGLKVKDGTNTATVSAMWLAGELIEAVVVVGALIGMKIGCDVEYNLPITDLLFYAKLTDPINATSEISDLPQEDLLMFFIDEAGYIPSRIPANANPTVQEVKGSGFLGAGSATVAGLLTTDVITATCASGSAPTCGTNGVLTFGASNNCWDVRVTRSGVLWAYWPGMNIGQTAELDASGSGNHLTSITTTTITERVDGSGTDYCNDNGFSISDGSQYYDFFLTTVVPTGFRIPVSCQYYEGV